MAASSLKTVRSIESDKVEINMLPDLVSLALFLRVAETSNITKAAESSFIAPTAASRRMALLEKQLNVQLLYRSTQGVELTPAGQALLHHIRQILDQVGQMQAELSDYAKGIKGLVRIQANTSAMAEILPLDLANFAKAFPEVKLGLEERRSVKITQAVVEGKTDIGIIVGGTPAHGLTCFKYYTDHLVAMFPKDHPLRSEKLFFAELLEFDFVGLDRYTAISRLLAKHAAVEKKPWRLRVEVKSFDAVCNMIHAGLGIGVLPEAAAQRVERALDLRLVPLADSWAIREMLLCVRDYDSLPLVSRQLVDFLLSSEKPA